MQSHTKKLLSTALLLLFAACSLGDEPVSDSPYDTAFFSQTNSTHVADGLTPVSVTVYGSPGSTLTVEVTNATMIGASTDEPSQSATVTLADVDEAGLGRAELQIVSTTPGLSRLSFTVAPLAALALVEFVPVEFVVGTPLAVSLEPGEVVHQLCVYSNTLRGSIAASMQGGSVTPSIAELQEIGPAPCEPSSEPLVGATLLHWKGQEAQANLDLNYLGPQGEAIAHSTWSLEGQAFPGYSAQLQDVEVTSQWARLQSRISYESTATLAESAAAYVSLDNWRSVPAGLTLVGTSSGGVGAPETDADGSVTLYLEVPSGTSQWSIFATPKGGGTLYLGEVWPFEPQGN